VSTSLPSHHPAHLKFAKDLQTHMSQNTAGSPVYGIGCVTRVVQILSS